MKKTYYITESQYNQLLESKIEQKKVFNRICEEIEKKKKSINETTQLNEGIVDTIKGYLRAGTLTIGIITALLLAMKVDTNQLKQACVPDQAIQTAVQNMHR